MVSSVSKIVTTYSNFIGEKKGNEFKNMNLDQLEHVMSTKN